MDDSFLRPDKTIIYPPNNYELFEEYFYRYYKDNNISTDIEYLPIFWTNLYCNRNFGRGDLSDIQEYLNNLDKNKKYFTIIQYDDGILQNVDHLDLLVFSHVGKGDIALPLINKMYENLKLNMKRDIFCSFVGPMQGRHYVREQMYDILKNEYGFYIEGKTSYNIFVELMNRSLFSLCPRGYGRTSFRINESLFFGSIPIFIYDKEHVPFNAYEELKKGIIFVNVDDINKIPNLLKTITAKEIFDYQKNGKLIWEKYFKYSNCANQIIKSLQGE